MAVSVADAHSVSQVGDRMLFHVRDETEPVCELSRDDVAEVRRRVMEPNGMVRTVAARVAVQDHGGSTIP